MKNINNTMSFFREEHNLDLSNFTFDELKALKNEQGTQLVDLSEEKNILNKQLRIVTKKVQDIEKNIKLILKEIKRLEDIEESKNIIGECIKNIDGFELLSEDELSIITTKMDKTDYRKYGNYPRYLDLERICKEVIEMKKKYPKWTLTNLASGGQYDSLPPQTFYRYEYQDEYGNIFDIGGIKLVSC